MKLTKTKLKQIIEEELQSLKEYSPYGKRARPPKRESVEGIAPDEPDDRTHGEGFADDNGLPQEPLAPSIDDAIDGYGVEVVMPAVNKRLESLRVELAKALNKFISDEFPDMPRFDKPFTLGEEKKIPSLKQIIKEELENLKKGEQNY